MYRRNHLSCDQRERKLESQVLNLIMNFCSDSSLLYLEPICVVSEKHWFSDHAKMAQKLVTRI